MTVVFSIIPLLLLLLLLLEVLLSIVVGRGLKASVESRAGSILVGSKAQLKVRRFFEVGIVLAMNRKI